MHENGSKIYNIKNVLFLDELPMSHDYDRNSIAQTGNCAFKKGFTLFCILNMNSPEIAIVTVFLLPPRNEVHKKYRLQNEMGWSMVSVS